MQNTRATKLVSQLRQIICHSNEATAINCAEVFLNATRIINHASYTGHKFLIANIQDFVRNKILFPEINNFKIYTELETMKLLCSDAGIMLLHLEYSIDWFIIRNYFKPDTEKPNGRIAYVNMKHLPSQSIESITVHGDGNNNKYVMAGRICENGISYGIYVDKSVPTQYEELFKKEVLKLIYNQINIILVEGVPEENINKLKRLLHYSKYNEIDLTEPLGSPQDLLELLHEVCLLCPKRLSIKKVNTYNDFEIQSINSETPITVIWFNDKAQNPDSYLPTILFNENTNKLNFLVWYSDSDQTGFMRHSAIKEEDALSARLTSHVKMLIYCEDMNRQRRYLKVLITYKSYTNENITQDKMKESISKEDYRNFLLEIPKINENYFRSPLSGEAIKNAFYLES